MNYIKELRNKIERYIDNDADEFALLIDGKWGSGKTYAIKHIISEYNKNENNLEQQMYYFSLNGILNMEDMFWEIDENHINFIKKIAPLCAKVVGSYALADTNISDDIRYALSSREKADMDVKTIVFDDIERCKCELDVIFAFINRLLRKGFKIVIVMNSEKLEDAGRYKIIKEKFIGTTIYWTVSKEIVRDIIENIKYSGFSSRQLTLFKKACYDVFGNKSNTNMRVLKKTILHSANIISMAYLPEEEDNLCFAYYQITKNVYDHFLSELNPDNQDDVMQNPSEISYPSYKGVLKLLSVKDYFDNGMHFDKEKYQKEISFLSTNTQLDFSYHRYMSEEEKDKRIGSIRKALIQDEYPLYMYPFIIQAVIHIDTVFEEHNFQRLYHYMINNIKSDNLYDCICNIDENDFMATDPMIQTYVRKINIAFDEHNKETLIFELKRELKSGNKNTSTKDIIDKLMCGEKHDYSTKYFDVIIDFFVSEENIDEFYLNNNYHRLFFNIMNKELDVFICNVHGEEDVQKQKVIKAMEQICNYLEKRKNFITDKGALYHISRTVSGIRSNFALSL